MQKDSIKREQSQAGLSFAERLRVGEPCSGMRKNFRPQVKNKLLLLLALLMTAATGAWAQEQWDVVWDFTAWSTETVTALKADAAASKTEGWSDVEKAADAEAGADPTDATKDNCFWSCSGTVNADGNLSANGVVIKELKGLKFNSDYAAKRSLAIAVNYPSTSLGDYAGGAYLWLGGGGSKQNCPCFTIPGVKAGSKITIEVESNKTSSARGIGLYKNSYAAENLIGEQFTPTAKEAKTWDITEDCDVVVWNTHSCHIYTIKVKAPAAAPADYTVSLKDGVKDADKWTISPNPAPEGSPVTIQYTGRLKVKGVTATSDAAPAAPAGKTVDLSTLTADYEAKDGDVLTGETSSYEVTIAAGATVTLDGVTINGSSYCIKCAGDATIILKDGSTNTLTNTGGDYPALSIGDANTTLTIQGSTGVLNVSSGMYCAGIGGGYANTNNTCGNIRIEGGVITAKGGYGGAGIGTDVGDATCGDIIITGGTITAKGGGNAAGIGSGASDSGSSAVCGDITIANTVTKVTATKGENAPYSIGKGSGGKASCGTVTIGGTKYWENNAAVNGGDTYLATSPLIYDPAAPAAPAGKTVDLSTLTADYEAQDGEVLTGTLGANVKISIADGATVTLDGVTINGVNDTDCEWAGITCLGDATIILSGTNTVKGFYEDYPGIQAAAAGKTLIINGTGSLTASSYGYGAGIGGKSSVACGDIEIQGGTITATSGDRGAGIGGGDRADCGNITISGGIINATGGARGAGIGGGRKGSDNGSCGNILISGGTVTATGGENAAGIGGGRGYNSGYLSSCGTITITSGVTKVTATKGDGATNSIGAGKYGTCGTVTIGGVEGAITTSPYTYDPTAQAKPAAAVTTVPTGAAVVGVGKTTALVSGGVADGGTLMFAVTTTNTKPTSTDGFSDAVPTAETIKASGKVYVWYYVKGDDTHSDSEIAATAIEVPVADIVWDVTNIRTLGVFEGNPYEREGVTLSSNDGNVYAWWNDYGDPTMDGIEFYAEQSGGYTFTAPDGKAFTKIEMKPLGPDGWDSANLGTGWAFNNSTVTWTGTAASTVDLLKDAGSFYGAPISYIAFYLSE